MNVAEKPETGAERRAARRPGRPTLSDEQLLDIALDLFLEHGFERTSIDAICAAAGMAKRTVYARYGDKKTLFEAALTRAIEDWIVPVERLRSAESDDIEATLLATARLLSANILSPAGLRLLRLTNAVSGRMPEIGAYSTTKGTELTLAYLADLFRRRLLPSDSSPEDADEAALGFLHLVTGPAINAAWGLSLDAAAIDRHTRYCVRIFLHGVRPAQGGEGAVQAENRRLRALAEDAAVLLAQVQERLRAAG